MSNSSKSPGPLNPDPTLCRAIACQSPRDTRALFCAPHWLLVPEPIQSALTAAYQPGDMEPGNNPSLPFTLAVARAIHAIAISEGRMTESEAEMKEAKIRRVIERWDG